MSDPSAVGLRALMGAVWVLLYALSRSVHPLPNVEFVGTGPAASPQRLKYSPPCQTSISVVFLFSG